jgi:ArsR family transcriptional regulator
MAFSKAHLFDQNLFTQSIWSKANAHPARTTILHYLVEHGLTSFSDLRKILPLAPTTVSQHIRHLYKNGYITCIEKCPHTYYDINRETCRNLAIKLTDMQLEFIDKR